ncbi:MAG: universal stress protein [Polyangiaceae bacterium]|nr:universal stress protein [Polyangiaceae bacterium]
MNKILVAIDGSERQDGVIDAGVALAKRTGAKIVLFRSVGIPREIPAAALMLSPDEVARVLEEKVRQQLEELARTVDPSVLDKSLVMIGTPWSSIDLAAREQDCDLIVIGSHGYGGVDRLLGTTAAKVVNHADRSVLVVRAPERLSR